MDRPILILLVEDEGTVAKVVKALIEQTSSLARVEVETTLAGALARLARPPKVDAVLLDLSLPDSEGVETFCKVRDAADSPVLILTGGGEAHEAEVMRNGAQDFLFKEELHGPALVRRVRYAILRYEFLPIHRALRKSREINQEMKNLPDPAPPKPGKGGGDSSPEGRGSIPEGGDPCAGTDTL